MRVGLLLATWVGLTGILIIVGFGVVHSSTVAAFDRHITSVVVEHRSPALNTAMRAVTWLGSWVALVITGAVVLLLAVRGRLAFLAVLLAVVVWAGEAAGVWLGKHVVQRQRPPKDLWEKSAHGWSWPSGHTATAVLVFTVLAIVATYVLNSRVIRIGTWAAAVIATAAVGFSRIELGVHWTTDVLASIVFVSGWLVVSLVLFGRELRGTPESEATSVSDLGQ
jgi:undecaprenyl-diphosphatase